MEHISKTITNEEVTIPNLPNHILRRRLERYAEFGRPMPLWYDLWLAKGNSPVAAPVTEDYDGKAYFQQKLAELNAKENTQENTENASEIPVETGIIREQKPVPTSQATTDSMVRRGFPAKYINAIVDFDTQQQKVADSVLKRPKANYYISGKRGCGKTLLITKLAKYIWHRAMPQYLTFTELTSLLTNCDKEWEVGKLKEEKLIVVDNFGIGKLTERQDEYLRDFLDFRYRNELPLWVCSNDMAKDLDMTKISYYQLSDYIRECWSVFHLTGGSYRGGGNV